MAMGVNAALGIGNSTGRGAFSTEQDERLHVGEDDNTDGLTWVFQDGHFHLVPL